LAPVKILGWQRHCWTTVTRCQKNRFDQTGPAKIYSETAFMDLTVH